MIGSIRNLHVRTLCTLAQGDESALDYPLSGYIYGFHAQQSCEKLLKALISSTNRTYPLTHSLKKLLSLLSECGETLPVVPYDLLLLEPFAVELRYDLDTELGEAERVRIRESVALIRKHVLARVLQMEETIPSK